MNAEQLASALEREWHSMHRSKVVAMLLSQAAEIEALRKDALRYRWLRDKADPDEGSGIYVSQYGVTTDWGKDLHPHFKGTELDAVIDIEAGAK